MKSQWRGVLRKFLAENPDCLWNDGRKEDVAIVNEHIPDLGEADTPTLERWRKAQRVYCDIYNDGGANCIDLNENNNIALWGYPRRTMRFWRRNPEALEKHARIMLDSALDELRQERQSK